MSKVILPGSTIGVLGSGQLGRMFAIAARRMGYKVQVLSPDDDTPTGQVADVEIQALYNDLDAVKKFAENVDVVTFEFENVPVMTIEAVNKHVPVYPSGNILHVTQQRIREKKFLRSVGIPVAPFQEIYTLEDLEQAIKELFPGILKKSAWGYDGKGQLKIESKNDAESVWNKLNANEAVLEQVIEFHSELSVIAARGQDQNSVFYGPFVNSHQNHILDLSVTPTDIPHHVSKEAVEITHEIMSELNYVGVLCVEFFFTTSGNLIVNELAPRPHNSGHLTIDAHETCQFEQQVRAVCGLPLGSPRQVKPAAMVNLLGDLWCEGEPGWASALGNDGLKLHLYGKKEPRIGRKMGHLTSLAESPEIAIENALSARHALLASQYA